MNRRAGGIVEITLSDMLRLTQRVLGWLAAMAVGTGALSGRAATSAEAQLAFFEQRIRPVLVERCYDCHSAGSKKLKGGLRLDTRAGMLAGGETRPAVVPGDAGKSLLIEAIRYSNPDLQMPPKGRLSEAVVADFVQWINEGAFDPRTETSVANAAGPARTNATLWSFQPIRRVEPPQVPSSVTHPLDRFIVAKLTENGLKAAPEADRRTLIRRASFDLTGLPPSPDEIHTYLNDTSPDAFERMIGRLLASPHYGERWGRWWLDVARYADTNGQDENKVMGNAWRYRDWVIGSFNRNQPFNEFIAEQLAGDLLPTNGVSEKVIFDRWTATGFLVLGPKMLAEQDKPKLVMDMIDEQIDVVSRAFLGLTVACARCHDHKFDPIAARDYYAMAGIFRSTKTMENLAFVSKFNERRVATTEHLAAIERYDKEFAAKNKSVEQAIREANEALQAGWKTNLATNLKAVATEALLGAEQPPLPTNAVTRIRTLLSSSNTVSRVLQRVLAEPQFAKDLVAAKEAATNAINGVRLSPGKVGGGFLANGHNYLELTNSAELEPAELTVETWFRVSEFPNGGDERRWLVGKNANELINGHYALILDGNRVGANLNVGGGAENVFALWNNRGELKPNQWHHAAMTYDGKALRVFVDGKSAGEVPINRPRVPGPGPLVLGRRPDGFVYFKGSLDEARVHRRALSASELKHNFEDPEHPVVSDAVARWEFNDLSDAERELVAQAEARDALFGPGGVFAIPANPRPYYPAVTRTMIVDLEKSREKLKAGAPAPAEYALSVEEDKAVDLPIHIRGSHLNLAKEPVPRGFIKAACRSETTAISTNQSGRLELANWIASAENPLTARVIVNRIWQTHFGTGLVKSSENFGVRGETPSHPEMLDWLASEFIRSGWDVKQLHRLILTSATWRQQPAHAGSGEPSNTDPDNRLLAHFPRQRLEVEMIRDALLAVSGRLDLTMGGTLVSWKNDDYAPGDTVSATSRRRSIYLPIVRDRVFDVFSIFDFANPSVGTSKRIPTVVSHQALFFLNSPLVKEAARGLARRVLAAAPEDKARGVLLAYELAFARLPSESEAERAREFIESMLLKEGADAEVAAWADWCQVLFAANEFIYLE